MSKLNPKAINQTFSSKRLAGGQGALAAKMTNYNTLRRLVLANLLWEDIAYCDGKNVSDQIVQLVPECTPEEVFELAVEARVEQKLRHTPLKLAVEMCRHETHRKLVGELLPKIITRADMLTDFLALYWADGKVPICRQAQNGLADAFHNFDEYQFAKYDRSNQIKLRDVMFLCHPKPRNEEEELLYKKIAQRELNVPDTWEVALSSGADKKATWTRLINENKLGSLAMLRNLSNMMRANVDKSIIKKGLSNIKSAMLLPLDFLKAAENAPEFERDIEDVMLKTYEKLPRIAGRTLFIVDISGSMFSAISSYSSFNRLDAAAAMAMLASCQCEDFSLVVTAGDDSLVEHKTKHIQYPKRGFQLIKQIKDMYNEMGGGGIFTRQCLEWCRKEFKKQEFDRIIIFSDSQDCDYPNKRVPKPFGLCNYICDVSAHELGINYEGVWTAEISGWSEHFLSYIAALEGVSNSFEQ